MKIKELILIIFFAFVQTVSGAGTCVKYGKWMLAKGNGADGITIAFNHQPIIGKLYAEYRLGSKLISSRDYSQYRIRESPITDCHGKGMEWTITYHGEGRPDLIQNFRIYQDYLLNNIQIHSDRKLTTNYMVPVKATSTMGDVTGKQLCTLFVPYDNDAWIRYRSEQTADTLRSYEVTAVYDATSRHGLVIGAIDHDKWKSAVDINNDARTLTAFSGVADRLTRDVHAHGYLSGNDIRSATIFIGQFDDWRNGLEIYARANTDVSPRREWKKAVPMGWNSWGALAFEVNYQNSTETSNFIATYLQNHFFCNADGLVYTGLDSGWNNFTEDELKDFTNVCRKNHQVPCIYWTPFTDWGKDPERKVPGVEEYRYKDIYLYSHGKPEELDGAYAIDPTHPAVRRMMEQTADLFRRCGFKYVKMDFMTHGRLEADSWYLPQITTGTQAYNYGMQLLDSIFHGMYLNLSISPIFPSQYAQSRRIACDAWNKIKDTEYTMNALSYGWWVGRLYDYNDADHVVLRDATEGENRARIMSSVITGIFILGDNYSASGEEEVKRRAMKYLTNPGINRIVDGRAFRPLNGNDKDAENMFIREEPDGKVYLAVFNYKDTDFHFILPLQRMELTQGSYKITELWSHSIVDAASMQVIPAKDAKIFLFEK